MTPLHHKKVFFIGVIFLASIAFFGFFMNRYLSSSRASEDKAIIFFEKPTIVTNADTDSIPVNIFMQMRNGNKVSGAQVQVAYSTDTLVYDTSRQGQFEVSCTGATNGLNNLVDVVHNEQAGTLRIRRVRVDNIDSNLPPLTDSGLFCFTTIYFKPKPGVLYPQNGTVTLSSDAASYEIVGPGKIYAPDFFSSTNSTTIMIGKSMITPTPVCKVGVKNFSLMQQCDTTSFHYISFTCQDGSTNQIGADETCEAQDMLKQKAQAACATKSSCSITVTPSPTCMPRPSCLDATPRCMIPEPIGGFCNVTPSPTPTEVPESDTPHLSFNPKNVTIPPTGSTFDVDVIIDAGKNNILATDARLRFDSSKLDVVSIKDGTYFEIPKKEFVNHDSPFTPCLLDTLPLLDLNKDTTITGMDYALGLRSNQPLSFMSDLEASIMPICGLERGEIYIAGIIKDPRIGKTGRGVLATITFRAKSKGTSIVTYVCRQGEIARDSNIANNSLKVEDVIDCAANTNLTVNNTIDVTPTPDSCPLKSKGDCSCNGKVDIFDFEAWRKEFTKELPTIKCDNNSDGKITLADFNRWLAGFFAGMKK